MEILTAANLALVPVVIGVTQVFKGFVAERFAPIVSLVLGVAASFVFPAVTVAQTVLAGIVVGLSASGLYSGTKTVTK